LLEGEWYDERTENVKAEGRGEQKCQGEDGK